MPTLKYGKDGAFERTDVYGMNTARRVATLKGFTPSGEVEALAEARAAAIIEGAPPILEAYPGDTSGCVLTERTVAIADGTLYTVIDDYRRPAGYTAPSGDINKLYVFAEDRTLVTVDRIKLPHLNDGEPIRIGWENPSDASQKIAPQTARFRVQLPALQLTIGGTFDVKPTFSGGLVGDAQGYVNSEVFRGLPAGYWLFAGAAVRRSPKQSRRTFQAVLLSMLTDDWGDYLVVEHPSGITPELDMSGVGDMYPTSTTNYVRPTPQSNLDKQGVAKIGPYPAIDFNEVFAAIDSAGE